MRKPSRLVLLAASVAAVGTLTLGSPASADPPGNNATIKIDGVAFDTAPNNEPHVGCRFQLDFYGYDQGNYNADVVFSVQPPTGKFVPILTDTVFVGEDAAGGGTDLDAEASTTSPGAQGLRPAPAAGVPRQGRGERTCVERRDKQVQGVLGRGLLPGRRWRRVRHLSPAPRS